MADFEMTLHNPLTDQEWDLITDTSLEKVASMYESLIRCVDCKYYDYENYNCYDESGFGRNWKPTDYCSYGERRTDG